MNINIPEKLPSNDTVSVIDAPTTDQSAPDPVCGQEHAFCLPPVNAFVLNGAVVSGSVARHFPYVFNQCLLRPFRERTGKRTATPT